MRNGMYDVLLPSTGTLVGSARPGHMAATEMRRQRTDGWAAGKAYLGRERRQPCRVLARMPATLRTRLRLLALRKRLQHLLGRLRREVLLRTYDPVRT